MQLVSERVKLYNLFKPQIDLVIEDIEAVREKFGTTPDHVIDVLAIMGDSSYNVPGVKGIGEKGAIKLVEQFGTVANLLEHLDEVKGRNRELIERDREQLLLSRELVTIDREVKLEPRATELSPPKPDANRLHELFRRLDFRSLAQKVADGTDARPAAERDDVLVRTAAELEAMIAELRAAGEFALDTETTSLFPLQAKLVGASFCARGGRAFYVPFNLQPPVLPGGPPAILEAMRELLTSPDLRRVGQNYKYDALVFHHATRALDRVAQLPHVARPVV
jgi:DNA polymerase-1